METTGNDRISVVLADMSDPVAVRSAAAEILASQPAIHVLIHNAGALYADRRETADGTETTIAAQVVGPFLLTSLLSERLRDSAPSRVITVSSGGMYAAALDVDHLQMGDNYRGTEQYARAKRAQVTLNELWAERFADSGVRFHAMHPGWADTPGVAESLPTFRRIVGPAAALARAGGRHHRVAVRRRRRAGGHQRSLLARPPLPQPPIASPPAGAPTPQRNGLVCGPGASSTPAPTPRPETGAADSAELDARPAVAR